MRSRGMRRRIEKLIFVIERWIEKTGFEREVKRREGRGGNRVGEGRIGGMV